MTPHTAAQALLIAEAGLLLICWRRLPVLAAYFALAQFPYLLLFLDGQHLAVGAGAFYASVWHAALAIDAAWFALPALGRRALLDCGALLGACGGLLFLTSSQGTVREFALEYFTITGAVIAATLTAAFPVLFAIDQPWSLRHWHALIVTAWFGGEVLIAAAYRALSGSGYDADWARLFVADCGLHGACVVAWGILIWKFGR